jgi:hypothetical protein
MALKAIFLLGLLIRPAAFLVREWRRDKCRSFIKRAFDRSPEEKVRTVTFYFWMIGLLGAVLLCIPTCSIVLTLCKGNIGNDLARELVFYALPFLAFLWCIAVVCLATAIQVKKRGFELRRRVIWVSLLSAILFPWGLGALVSLWAWAFFRDEAAIVHATLALALHDGL